MSIILLPLGVKSNDPFVRKTYDEIKRFLPNIEMAASLDLPVSAYYKPRGRYRADSLIHWMSLKAKDNQIYLGITTTDISATKGGYADWGLMGLGYCPGNAAVASNFRVKDKYQFWKVAIHELGHTSGLPHCPVKTCFMRDAEGKDNTEQEIEFCEKCKAFLIEKGWRM